MTEEDQVLRLACSRILSGHKNTSVRGLFQVLSSHPAAERLPDFYGVGGAVAELEARTASLLGKERGLFVINGVTAQMTVLRRYAECAGVKDVVIHPQSHIDVDEMNGLERVAGLSPVRLGRIAPFTLSELQRISGRLAAVVIELPLRRAGYLLPPLDELRAISAHCRSLAIPLHFDGARLWEAAAAYDISLGELASLADSVYVSFYKGIGGLGGAVIAGRSDFIDSVTIWKSRFGGNLFTAFPYAIAALAGLDRHLPAMPEYVRRARELADALAGRLLVNPAPAHANAFHVILPGTREKLAARNKAFAKEHGVWLFNTLVDAPIANHTVAEVVMGDNCMDYDVQQAVGWIEAFVRRAD